MLYYSTVNSSESFDPDLEGSIVLPSEDRRIAFAQHVYREILLIILQGNSLIQYTNEETGEVQTFRLPPPENILDFVQFRCTGRKVDGNIEAHVKVLLPAMTDGSEDVSDYLACELTYFFPEDQS